MQRHKGMMGVGLAALSAAALGTFSAAHAAHLGEGAHLTGDTHDHVVVVDAAGAAAVAEATPAAADPHLISPQHGRWALMLAFGGVVASLVSMIGFNGLLNNLAQGGKAAAKAVASAAVVPVKAAASVAGRVLGGPTRIVLGAGLVGVVLVASIALLDIQWKAGLVVGAGTAIAGVVGWAKVKGQFRRPKPQATPGADGVAAA